MSLVRCCPYREEKENCKYEVYYGQPRFDKCPTCKRMKEGTNKMTEVENVQERIGNERLEQNTDI